MLFLLIGGLLIGWLVDIGWCMWLLGFSIVLWSFVSVGCGLVSGYVWLLECWIGVGVGEVMMMLIVYLLIGDYFLVWW